MPVFEVASFVVAEFGDQYALRRPVFGDRKA
jgi:hypothetical protein